MRCLASALVTSENFGQGRHPRNTDEPNLNPLPRGLQHNALTTAPLGHFTRAGEAGTLKQSAAMRGSRDTTFDYSSTEAVCYYSLCTADMYNHSPQLQELLLKWSVGVRLVLV